MASPVLAVFISLPRPRCTNRYKTSPEQKEQTRCIHTYCTTWLSILCLSDCWLSAHFLSYIHNSTNLTNDKGLYFSGTIDSCEHRRNTFLEEEFKMRFLSHRVAVWVWLAKICRKNHNDSSDFNSTNVRYIWCINVYRDRDVFKSWALLSIYEYII